MKTCSKCRESLEDVLFGPDSSQSGGLSCYCRPCRRLRDKERRQTNLEEIRAKDRQRYAQAPEAVKSRNLAHYYEHREKILPSMRDRSKRHWQENKEYLTIQHRTYYLEHKEQQLAYAQEYMKTRRDLIAKSNHNRRIKLKNAPKDGTVTLKAITELLISWTGVCPFCARKADPTIDHILALANGGSHSLDNLQLMCGSCNSSKGKRPLMASKQLSELNL